MVPFRRAHPTVAVASYIDDGHADGVDVSKQPLVLDKFIQSNWLKCKQSSMNIACACT